MTQGHDTLNACLSLCVSTGETDDLYWVYPTSHPMTALFLLLFLCSDELSVHTRSAASFYDQWILISGC